MLKDSSAITSWAKEDRPREKMISKGKNALSDAELLAILIGTGSGKSTAVDLGRNLLQLCNGDLYELGKLRMPQMCSLKGIGPTKAVKLMAALELGRRRKEQQTEKKQKVISSLDGYNLILLFRFGSRRISYYFTQPLQRSVGSTANFKRRFGRNLR